MEKVLSEIRVITKTYGIEPSKKQTLKKSDEITAMEKKKR